MDVSLTSDVPLPATVPAPDDVDCQLQGTGALRPVATYVELLQLPDKWKKTESSNGGVMLMKIVKCGDDERPIISHSITINSDKTWSACILSKDLRPHLSETYPSELPLDLLHDLVEAVDAYKICPGNPDDHFVEMVMQHKDGKVMSRVKKWYVNCS